MTTRSAPAARYPIRTVAKLTGVGIDTLRAWERRHGAVEPSRDDRGRMYTEADISRLRLLRAAVDRGNSIGRLARLDDADLRSLIEANDSIAKTITDPRQKAPSDTEALHTALLAFDTATLDREIRRLATVLRPPEFLRHVVMPVLVQVGEDWHRGRAGIAHEHLLSATIRNVLASFLQMLSNPDAPTRLLFATPAGERHEITTLGAAVLAASCGLGVVYLGADVPARDIASSVEPAGVRVVVVGLTTTSAAKAREREVRAIVRDLPRDVELWAGGPGAQRFADLIGERGLVLENFDEYLRELIRIGGRAA